MHPDWIVPDGLPEGVSALMTTRAGGVSRAPWDSMNVGDAVGDDSAAVARNRAILADALSGAHPVYLRQQHATRVVRIDIGDARRPPAEADASFTIDTGVAITVQVADCLPVLLAAHDGSAVAAAHAGWRGLAGGVIEVALRALCDAAPCAPAAVHAWLGPCIGARHFEVGDDVFEAFGGGARFVPAPASGGARKWHADLIGLARDRLRAAGVVHVRGELTVLLVPARSHHRPDGCGHLA
jgi:YfiH family protein